MRLVWLIPLTILALGAGAYYRARRRADNPRSLTSEPVSGEWLAEARGREENRW
jgi:cytochrome c-type biogenesis protein CcmH/NrfF